MIVASIGEIMHAPVMQTMLANSIPNHKRSSYMAVYGVAVILGVSTAGVFLIMSSWVFPFVITGMIGLMGFISIGLMRKLTVGRKYTSRENAEVKALGRNIK